MVYPILGSKKVFQIPFRQIPWTQILKQWCAVLEWVPPMSSILRPSPSGKKKRKKKTQENYFWNFWQKFIIWPKIIENKLNGIIWTWSTSGNNLLSFLRKILKILIFFRNFVYYFFSELMDFFLFFPGPTFLFPHIHFHFF